MYAAACRLKKQQTWQYFIPWCSIGWKSG